MLSSALHLFLLFMVVFSVTLCCSLASHRSMTHATENSNPFERLAVSGANGVSVAYSYLHFSGCAAVLTTLWLMYPSYCRWRHVNVARYRKEQVTLRRKLVSRNIPSMEDPSETRYAKFVLMSWLFYRWCDNNMTLPILDGPGLD